MLTNVTGSGPVRSRVSSVIAFPYPNICTRAVSQSIKQRTTYSWYTNPRVSAFLAKRPVRSLRTESWLEKYCLKRRVLFHILFKHKETQWGWLKISWINLWIRVCPKKKWKPQNRENANDRGRKRQGRKQRWGPWRRIEMIFVVYIYVLESSACPERCFFGHLSKYSDNVDYTSRWPAYHRHPSQTVRLPVSLGITYLTETQLVVDSKPPHVVSKTSQTSLTRRPPNTLDDQTRTPTARQSHLHGQPPPPSHRHRLLPFHLHPLRPFHLLRPPLLLSRLKTQSSCLRTRKMWLRRSWSFSLTLREGLLALTW